MANYRQIHVSMWKDEWILELTPEEKLLFVYLFSNESTSLSGLYKIAKRVIAFETGLNMDFVNATLAKFEKAGKVYYQDGLIWVVNLRRYNRGGDTVFARIQNDVATIPDCPLKRRYLAYYSGETTPTPTPEEPSEPEPIPYPYPIDTLSGSGVKCNEMKCNESISANAEQPPSDFGKSSQPKDPPAPKPAKPRRAAADPRSRHPAILCVKGITGKYPPLEIYDDVIQILGESPDGPKLATCHKEWSFRGYNPNSWNWLREWYVTGIPPNGKPKTPQPTNQMRTFAEEY